jgi:hypothetical protein
MPSAGASRFLLTFLALKKVRRLAGRDPPVLLLVLLFLLISERNVNSSQSHSHPAAFGLSIMYIMVIYKND